MASSRATSAAAWAPVYTTRASLPPHPRWTVTVWTSLLKDLSAVAQLLGLAGPTAPLCMRGRRAPQRIPADRHSGGCLSFASVIRHAWAAPTAEAASASMARASARWTSPTACAARSCRRTPAAPAIAPARSVPAPHSCSPCYCSGALHARPAHALPPVPHVQSSQM